MERINVAGLRKLYQAGSISITTYFKWKKMKIRQAKLVSFTKKEFDLNAYSDDECRLMFRFTKHEINLLVKALEIPTSCRIKRKAKFTGKEGFCILLRRLSYPNRLTDLVKTFGRDGTSISRIFNWMLRYLYFRHAVKLNKLKRQFLTDLRLRDYLQSCQSAGSVYPNVIGFIDGTARPICRPIANQRLQYSGYKKQHVIKYQSIIFPDGLIGRLDGPFNGIRHDAAILGLSNLKYELGKLPAFGLENLALYGDPGYSNQKFIKVGYKNYSKLTDKQKQFNADMSALRVSVEYGFGKIVQQFAYLDFKKNQQVLLQNLKLQYYVAALLVNCQTCLRGNQTSIYFDCVPPSLDVYLSK